MQRYQVTKTSSSPTATACWTTTASAATCTATTAWSKSTSRPKPLDRMGMVIDFGALTRSCKTWVDENLDHRMLLCRADPLVPVLLEAGRALLPHGREPDGGEHRQADLGRRRASRPDGQRSAHVGDQHQPRHVPGRGVERVAVLTSGGLDSSVLLADLARDTTVFPDLHRVRPAWEEAEKATLRCATSTRWTIPTSNR